MRILHKYGDFYDSDLGLSLGPTRDCKKNKVEVPFLQLHRFVLGLYKLLILMFDALEEMLANVNNQFNYVTA